MSLSMMKIRIVLENSNILLILSQKKYSSNDVMGRFSKKKYNLHGIPQTGVGGGPANLENSIEITKNIFETFPKQGTFYNIHMDRKTK